MGRGWGEKSVMLHIVVWCFKTRKHSNNWSERWEKVEASYTEPVTQLEVGIFLFYGNYFFQTYTREQ